MAIKILSIGDICAVSAQRCLAKIARCDGVEITCGVMSLPDADLATHADAIISDLSVYTFDYCANGSIRINSEENCSFSYVLSMFDWDYITVNQRIDIADKDDTYFPYINEISDFIKQKCPDIKLVINEPWALLSNHSDMSAKIREISIAIAENTNMNIVFPVGEVWEKIRLQYPELELSTDDIKSSRLGDFVSGAVWYEILTGYSIVKNNYRVPFVNSKSVEKLRAVVHEVTEKYILR